MCIRDSLFKDHNTSLIVFFILVEILSRGSMLLYQKALSIAPAAVLVQTIVSGLQPFFIFILTVFFALITPSTVQKIKFDKIFAFHLSCVVVMTFGLYLLLIKG